MKYALVHLRLLNGHADMEPVDGKAVVVENGLISAVTDEASLPSDLEKIDLGGRYLLPGLINLHVHLPAGGKPSKKPVNYEKVAKLLKFGAARAVVRRMCAGYARQQLFSGTTTIRAVGGVLDFDTRLRDAIRDGKTVGPRILAANSAISVPGGHMTGSVALPAHSPEEAMEMVRARAAEKPDLIKLMITGGVLDSVVPGEPGVLRMPREYVEAAAAEAHRLGYKVAAHVESSEGMVVALEGGVDTIEHGGRPDEYILRLFKEKNAVLVGTLSPAVPFAMGDPAVTGFTEIGIINGKALFEHMKECIVACMKNGVTVGMGTDTGCPFVTHYDTWRELWYFCKYCGITPREALHIATEVNAKIAGLENVTGTVDVGKSADFAVVENNPLDDPANLRQVTDVIMAGRLFRSPKVKRVPAVEAELNRMMTL